MPPTPALVSVVAIVALTVIEVSAQRNNIDGIILSVVVAAIAGLAGYVLPSPWQKR